MPMEPFPIPPVAPAPEAGKENDGMLGGDMGADGGDMAGGDGIEGNGGGAIMPCGCDGCARLDGAPPDPPNLPHMPPGAMLDGGAVPSVPPPKNS